MALASFTGRSHALLGRLGELQEAFSALLGDAGETTQEMASRGLSVVYTLGDRGAQEQLLASLMGTLQGAALAPGHFAAHVEVGSTVDPVRTAGFCMHAAAGPVQGMLQGVQQGRVMSLRCFGRSFQQVKALVAWLVLAVRLHPLYARPAAYIPSA